MHFDKTQMDGLSNEQKAAKALMHVLEYLGQQPRAAWYLGVGTESFALMTEALAALLGSDLVTLREGYAPEGLDPVKEGYDAGVAAAKSEDPEAHHDYHKATEFMASHGGSFAQALAEAWQRADSQNRYAIECAFRDLFEKYARFGCLP